MNPTVCYPKTALKHYMAGWTDAGQSSVIEAHLAECETCEQTLAELENEPETLLEFLQGNHQISENSPRASDPTSDPVVSYALSKAKQLNQELISRQEQPDESWRAPTSLGPYDLLLPIGQGSMGRVYLAKHRQLGKRVAVKVFAARAFRSDQYALRFEREVRAAGALQHASIINATDAGQADGVHYLVMEYIEGLDLSRLARSVGPLSIADVCAIGQAMALGLEHAHAAGIVHRDIKPSNVMLSLSGQVKLLDFGLAQVTLWDEASAELTTVGQLMGTIDYMAPEQAERAESVDYRADLYALGATLFRLLCGRAPLAASPNLSPLSRLRLLATSSPPTVRTLRSDVPLELEQLISELLSRSPDQRPASAAHVAERLSPMASDANLTVLIRTAQQRDPAGATDFADNSVSLKQGKLTESSQLPISTLSSNIQSANPTQPPRRIARWFSAAAAGAFALAAIVLITLETQKGQIVIESVDAQVTVQLSKDGHVERNLTVVPGTNSTRIAAGQYDVSIASGSDQFALDRETLEIKRGETVIARVRQIPSPRPRAPNNTRNAILEPSATLPPEEESPDVKVYDGKSLAAWRRELIRDRSFEAIKQALGAVGALANSKERPQIIQEFLESFPDHLTSQNQFDLLQEVHRISRDSATFVNCVHGALDKADDDMAAYLLSSTPYFVSKRKDVNRREWFCSIVPLAGWSKEFLSDKTLSKANDRVQINSAARLKLIKAAGNCIAEHVRFLRDQNPREQEAEQAVVETMKTFKHLDERFWMRVAEVYFPEPPLLMAAVEERATHSLLTSQDAECVSVATLLLTHSNSPSFDRTGMPTLKRRDEIVAKIRERLREFITQPQTIPQNVDYQKLVEDRRLEVATKLEMSQQLFRPQLSVNLGYLETNPCFDLLRLAATLQASEEIAVELNDLLMAVRDPATSFAARVVAVQEAHNVRLHWPAGLIDGKIFVISVEKSPPAPVTDLSPKEISAAVILSQIESMLTKEKCLAIKQDLSKQIRAKWIDAQLKQFDANQDGAIDSNELPSSRAADSDGDRVISRAELEEFYDGNTLFGEYADNTFGR